MILTCPECATSYFVDDSRISSAGRTVKCSSCGARWTALPDAPQAAEEVEAPPAAAAEPAPALDDLVIEEAEPRVSPPLEAPVFAPRFGRAPRQEAKGKVLAWAGGAVVVLGLAVAAIVFRGQVVKLAPASQGAYAAVGLPVSALAIENVHAEPTFQGGQPVLAVSGAIRNSRDVAATAPSLRVSLLDKAGKPVTIKVAKPIDALVPARAVRHFSIAIVDPPASLHDLEVTFETPAQARSAPPATARAAEAILGAPEPIDAKPLAPGSPDALPPHD
jgi:predicted Zn finger-like uncharacterized protein